MNYELDTENKPAKKGLSDKKLIEKARRCLRTAINAEKEQREREKEDLRFQIPENQWTPEAKEQRAGDQFTPPRPMLSVSLLKQPMQLVYNQFTRARLGVFVHPVGEKANKENAEAKQGLYRRIERDGGAHQARGWGFLRALNCGRGWYRVVTRYDEDADLEGDGAWDQEIAFERILHQENVYVDPAAQKADFSDARWAMVVAWKTLDDFKLEFPGADVANADSGLTWDGLAEEEPDWVRAGEDDSERAFLVAEYWYKDITRERLEGPNGQVRYRESISVHVCKLNGFEVLEKQEWNGRYIPLIPVIAEELIPVDGKRIWQGMVRPARDAQMGYNFAISSAVEDVARTSKTPYIGWVGQFETDKAKWNTLNVRNWPYVEADTVLVDNKPAPSLPQPFPIDGTKLQLSVQMAEQFKGMVQAATAVHEPSLGDLPKRRDAQSGRAILALQQQSDAGTSQFAQNLTDITLPYESLVVLDLMKTIYDREARVTSIVTGEDENKPLMLGVPFVLDPNTGQPVEAPGNPRAEKPVNLADGKYGVSVSFGKNPQTRMEAGQQFTAEMVSAAPELMGVIGDLLFEFRDEPGAKEISKRMKVMIRKQHPEFFDEEQTGADQAQAENAALKQQLQLLNQQLQQAVQAIQTKQVEQAAKIEVERIKADADLKMQELKNVGLITVAQIQAEAKGAQEETKARNEAAATGLEIEADASAQAAEHVHERTMQQEKLAHASVEAAADAQERARPEEQAGNGAEA